MKRVSSCDGLAAAIENRIGVDTKAWLNVHALDTTTECIKK
jgi:hypothetical protein